MKPEIVTVELTPQEWEKVSRPIVGGGGHQTGLRRILQRANRATRTLTLTPLDIERATRYGGDYGNGGYQDRYRAIVTALGRVRR